MLQDLIHPPEQHSLEGLSSPIAADVFDFSDAAVALFPDTIQNYEASSSSSCWYDDASYAIDLPSSFVPFSSEVSCFTDSTTIATTSSVTANDSLSILLDAHSDTELEASMSLDFTSSMNPTAQYPAALEVPSFIQSHSDHLNLPALQIPSVDMNHASVFPAKSAEPIQLVPGLHLGAMLEDDGFSHLPVTYSCVDPPSPSPSSFLDQPILGNFVMENLNGGISLDGLGLLSGSIMSENRLNLQELEFQTENYGVYTSESVYSSNELPMLNENQQHLIKGGCGSPIHLASEMSTLDESSFRVGRLSAEERKEKINRYMKKRNERNFNKKIKYACRKTLADSRPRVRGRFAKNDEPGEARPSCDNHDEEDEEDVCAPRMKEEQEHQDCSDIFAHIGGVNSLKCNFSIQSWM